ncbi:DUF443 family protein [Streptococcus sp. H49]|uniref:DUF443 family protein n=1 Tax=Streptococcus huangxiaojuni TaxID=3237239 RepID=UPI0034A4D632
MYYGGLELVTINSRYLVFSAAGNYYLLDRKPKYFVGYFFLPTAWLVKQKLYLLTESDYLKLVEKVQQNRASGIVVPASFSGAGAVLLSLFIRRSGLMEQLDLGFSLFVNSIIVCLMFLLAFALVQWVYLTRYRKIASDLSLEQKRLVYAKLIPERLNKTVMKAVFVHIVLWILTLAVTAAAILSGNLFFLFSTLLLFFLSLLFSGIGQTSLLSYKLKILRKNR